jgi:Phasin protein
MMAKEGSAEKVMRPVEVAKEAEKQFRAVAETQKDIFETLMKMNQHWMERASAEAQSMTDLGTKLTSARSLPDAAEAYQQWVTERTRTLAEDSQHFMADCQKFFDGVTRSLPKAWPVRSS